MTHVTQGDAVYRSITYSTQEQEQMGNEQRKFEKKAYTGWGEKEKNKKIWTK